MLKKLSPLEFKRFIVEATGRPGQTYISQSVIKALRAKGLTKHLTSNSASPDQIRKAVKTLKEEGLLSGYRGYAKKSPENIFIAFQKRYGLKGEMKKTILEKEKVLERKQLGKQRVLDWEKRIEAHRRYIQKERIREEREKIQKEKEAEEKSGPEIPRVKEAEDLPLAV